jgi:hypothetical protein
MGIDIVPCSTALARWRRKVSGQRSSVTLAQQMSAEDAAVKAKEPICGRLQSRHIKQGKGKGLWRESRMWRSDALFW